jgi:hypothetical protein
MADHSPLPWEVETVKCGPDLFEGMLVKSPGHSSYVADTFIGMQGGGDIPEAECRANAEFIARACNQFDSVLAEVERLRADRAALLASWVDSGYGRWWIGSNVYSVPPSSFATREEAEAAVLKWARGRKR